MKQLGWTSLEQSKTLLKNGLDEKSADLYWICGRIHTDGPKYQVLVTAEACYDKESAWPAWSLGKLIELMPREPFITKSDKSWFVSFDIDDSHTHQFSGINLIDTVVDVFLWLLDNGYIKKENKL